MLGKNNILSNAIGPVLDRLLMRGSWIVEHIRNGLVIGSLAFPNLIVNEGKNKLFDVMFRNQAQIATWYIGLMDNTGYTANVATDTANSHAGWTEFQGYTEATRQAWAVDAAANQQITNSAPAVFNINATGNVRGIFVISLNTKGGTTGVLWSTALFPTVLPVTSGDQVKITYTVAA